MSGRRDVPATWIWFWTFWAVVLCWPEITWRGTTGWIASAAWGAFLLAAAGTAVLGRLLWLRHALSRRALGRQRQPGRRLLP